MGTNASKKFASKIVAIFLAALMLVSVLPMTAFAADARVEGEDVVIVGFTVTEPTKTTGYTVGQNVKLDGLVIEVSYRYQKDIDKVGDKAPLYAEDIEYTEYAKFIDDLDNYGIKCNYSDFVKEAKKETLDLSNNTETLKLFYGENGKSVWETDIVFQVVPANWEAAEKVNLYEDGEYIVVIDGDYVLTSKTVDTKVVASVLAENALAVEKFDIDNDGGVITNLTEQLKAKEGLKKAEILWNTAFVLDEDNNYTITLDNEGNKVTDKEIKDAAVAKTEWALVADADGETEWMFNADGTICVAKAEDVEGVVSDTILDTKYTYYYIALAENAYLTLTTDAKKAAEFDFYQVVPSVKSKVEMIEIVKDADKMTYADGETFNAAGMIVNVSYADGTVICVPAALFDAFGVDVVVSEPLTLADNDQYISVKMGGKSDMSNKPLVVTAEGKDEYILTDGRLTNGLYAIVWSDDVAEKVLPNETYNGIALTNDLVSVNRKDEANTDFVASTLGGSDVTFRNNALGEEVGKNFITGARTMTWQITLQADGSFTISIPGTDTYLNRVAVTDLDKWAAEAGQRKATANDDLGIMLLALGEKCEGSYWEIDGTVNAAIESFTSLSTADNYYILQEGGVFAAVKDTDDAAFENFFFFKTETAVKATKLEIVDQADSKYNSGDKLDLSDLVAKITYSNGTWTEVAFDDFVSYGITVNFANGATLAGSDNGKNVVISLGDLTATGAALEITDSKADASIVRLGGADRYATAALIADSYVAALGENYKGVAVLTSGVNYPDALAGGTLAYALNAPIVLTKAEALVSATESFLKDNAVKTVYIIGGEAAVSADVEAALKAMNITVTRIAGADRVETSVNVGKQLAAVKGYSDTIILTNGANFADALSVSSAAAQLGIPVVYVNGALSESVKGFIADAKASKAIILGGTAAVSADAEAAVKALGLSVERVAGADRYATGVAIAEYFADCYTGKAVAFATGKDFPDALAGSVFAAYAKAPVVLLDNGYVNADAAEYAAGLDLTNVYVFGGTDALSEATVNATLLK